jgi:RimJ/RimL family protein N-acetyltransferase
MAACLLRQASPLSILEKSRRKLGDAAARVRIGRAGRQERPRRRPFRLRQHDDKHGGRPIPPCCSHGTARCEPWPSRSSVSLLSTTAYSGEAGDGTLGLERLSFRLPLVATVQGRQGQRRVVEVDSFRESEWRAGMNLMNQVIKEGKSWPFEEEFATLEDYRAYFMSHAALCVRDVTSSPNSVLGCFYVKPNFPGRCAHVCNGGFITAPEARKQGVATLMGHIYLQAAKDLGYRSSYFNLVFANNVASVRLWESLGFERVAVLPKAARTEDCRDEGGLETAYGYWYDLDALPSDYLSKTVT